MRTGRPPTDPALLYLAVELIRNGASTAEAARSVGVGRNCLSMYGISKRAVDRAKEGFVIQLPTADQGTVADKICQIERSVANSFRSVINRSQVPLIATVEAAQMDSDRLQACVRAERLRNTAKRLER